MKIPKVPAHLKEAGFAIGMGIGVAVLTYVRRTMVPSRFDTVVEELGDVVGAISRAAKGQGKGTK